MRRALHDAGSVACVALLATLAASCRLDPEPAPAGGVIVKDAPLTGIAFPSRRQPVAVPEGGLLVVADAYDDALSIIDPAGPKRVARVPVGRSPVDVDAPWSVAVDPARGVAFVALHVPILFSGAHGGHSEHGSVPGIVQVLALDDLRPLGETDVDAEPAAISLSEDGSRVVVLHRYLAGLDAAVQMMGDVRLARARLAVFDPDELASDPRGTTATYVRLCVAPAALALSKPDGKRAYAACFGEDALAVVDLDAAEPAAQLVPLGPTAGPPGAPLLGPSGIALSPDGTTIAVTSVGAFDVRFFDEAAPAFDPARRVVLGARPGAPAWSPSGDVLFVPVQYPDGIVAVDPVASAIVAQRSFETDECLIATQAAMAADGSLLVLCSGVDDTGGRLLSLDATTLETLGSTQVGWFAQSVAPWPGGRR